MVDDLEKQDEVIIPTEPIVPPESQKPRQDEREYNFRAMRERAERAEQRAQELERALQPKIAPKEELELEDDGLVEGKHLKRYGQTVKEMKEELERTKKQLESFSTSSIELQLRSKFNDFDQIVTNENLERLSREKPSLYRSIIANPDLRDKGETAYDAITTFLQPGKYAKEDRRIDENKNKPRSASTVSPQASDSPLARVGDYDRRTLSAERKKEIYREMKEAQQG